MSVIEKSPPATGDPDWKFWEREFTYPIERYPKGHLVGRKVLEDRVASAEAAYEAGLPLSSTQRDLLELAHQDAFDDYDHWPE